MAAAGDGGAVWSLTQLPMVLCSSVGAFVLARTLLSMGEGPAWPVALHAVYKWFPNRRRNLPWLCCRRAARSACCWLG